VLVGSVWFRGRHRCGPGLPTLSATAADTPPRTAASRRGTARSPAAARQRRPTSNAHPPRRHQSLGPPEHRRHLRIRETVAGLDVDPRCTGSVHRNRHPSRQGSENPTSIMRTYNWLLILSSNASLTWAPTVSSQRLSPRFVLTDLSFSPGPRRLRRRGQAPGCGHGIFAWHASSMVASACGCDRRLSRGELWRRCGRARSRCSRRRAPSLQFGCCRASAL
jgi:hypothetical protein